MKNRTLKILVMIMTLTGFVWSPGLFAGGGFNPALNLEQPIDLSPTADHFRYYSGRVQSTVLWEGPQSAVQNNLYVAQGIGVKIRHQTPGETIRITSNFGILVNGNSTAENANSLKVLNSMEAVSPELRNASFMAVNADILFDPTVVGSSYSSSSRTSMDGLFAAVGGRTYLVRGEQGEEDRNGLPTAVMGEVYAPAKISLTDEYFESTVAADPRGALDIEGSMISAGRMLFNQTVVTNGVTSYRGVRAALNHVIPANIPPGFDTRSEQGYLPTLVSRKISSEDDQSIWKRLGLK